MELIVTYGSRDFELDLSRCLVFGHSPSRMIAQIAATFPNFAATFAAKSAKVGAICSNFSQFCSNLRLQEVA